MARFNKGSIRLDSNSAPFRPGSLVAVGAGRMRSKQNMVRLNAVSRVDQKQIWATLDFYNQNIRPNPSLIFYSPARKAQNLAHVSNVFRMTQRLFHRLTRQQIIWCLTDGWDAIVDDWIAIHMMPMMVSTNFCLISKFHTYFEKSKLEECFFPDYYICKF